MKKIKKMKIKKLNFKYRCGLCNLPQPKECGTPVPVSSNTDDGSIYICKKCVSLLRHFKIKTYADAYEQLFYHECCSCHE